MKKPEQKITKTARIGIVAVVVVILGAWWIGSLTHATAVARQNAAMATELGNQGVTGIGTPNAAAHTVTFTVNPTCKVTMFVEVSGGTATLYLSTVTGNGTTRHVDTVTNAATATAVRANLPALGFCT